MTESYKLAEKIVKILEEKKAAKIEVIDVSEVSSLADYFIICEGGSSTQVKALADAVEEKIEKEGDAAYHKEGYSSATWVLLDYVDVVVHVFYGETRDFYNLERLWADGKKINLTSETN